MTAVSSKEEKDENVKTAGAEYAKKVVTNMFETSKIGDNAYLFPKFDMKEIKLGKVLGKGGFGTVSEVKGFVIVDGGGATTTKKKKGSLSKGSTGGGSSRSIGGASEGSLTSDPVVESGEMESRKFISDHCIRKGGDCRYALKILSPEVVKDTGMCIQGCIDMAVETRVLSDIEHPNIIKMRACSVGSPFFDVQQYFIIMDRLYDTLEHRIKKWEKRTSTITGVAGKLLDRKGTKMKTLVESKLVAGFDLAAAILYLHNRNILYRDLKPENVGFDIRDDVKLFDFGLAKEVHPKNKDSDGYYKLTAMTGSPRYMSPEVALGKPYNESCDVYSFSILFWEMWSCRVPFELYRMSTMKERVWGGEIKRPLIQQDWPLSIKNMLSRGWSANPKERLTFDAIYKILKTECVSIRGGDETGLEHNRRRSTYIFNYNATPENTGKGSEKPQLLTLDELDGELCDDDF